MRSPPWCCSGACRTTNHRRLNGRRASAAPPRATPLRVKVVGSVRHAAAVPASGRAAGRAEGAPIRDEPASIAPMAGGHVTVADRMRAPAMPTLVRSCPRAMTG